MATTKKPRVATKHRAAKQSKKTLLYRIKTYNFFLIFAVLLGMIAGVLMVKIFYTGEPRDTAPSISLGAIEYDFSNGKAVKRQSPAINSLRVFLTNQAAKDCTGMVADAQPSRYEVIAATKDVSQVLLGYGCGSTNAHMYAVRSGDSWRFISPTNHFDTLYGLPECDYIKQYGISREIAPVCYFVKNDTVRYKTL